MIHAIRRPMSFGGQGIALRIHDLELKLTDDEARELVQALASQGITAEPLMVVAHDSRDD